MKCGVFYHSDFADYGYITLRHRVKPGFDALSAMVKSGTIEVFTPIINEHTEKLLMQTHHEDLINDVKKTPYHEVALLSAAGVIQAAEKLATGELDFAFCFVGTGGHHAGCNYYWGFCYYNDVAMAVKHLKTLGVNKIMIMDIDPHSGDGTRDILAHAPSVIHINFYADEDYDYADTNKQNYGMNIDGADDNTFLKAVDKFLQMDFDYEFLIVIFGHDGHGQDYGDFYLTTEGYRKFAQKIKDYAVNKPILFVLSGGSNPWVAAEVIPEVVGVFAG